MINKSISYRAGGETCRGYLSHEESDSKKPLVMVVHAFEGCNEFAKKTADKLSALGYVGFAVDMYGEGRTADTLEGCMDYAMKLFNDRQLVRQRMLETFAFARTLSNVDASKTAAIGFCLGGLCCLDLARSGADVCGIASFHGALVPPEGLDVNEISAKMLVMTGSDDPQIPTDQVDAFLKEMKACDLQLIQYSQTKHAFTDPEAHKIGPPEMGREYNELTAKRSWKACLSFLDEIL